MCGIVGIIGRDDVSERLVEALKRLEYRGYDSAGIAIVQAEGALDRRRAPGKLKALEDKLAAQPLSGPTGIGHTRWATHGPPTESNAHPHATPRLAVVHNGIIENHAALKAELTAAGAVFETETDTEVIAHLVTHELEQGKNETRAAFDALDRLQGAFALAILFRGRSDLLVAARHGTPLAIGYGSGEMYLASDSYALAPLTREVSFLEDGDRVVLGRSGAHIYGQNGEPVSRPVRQSAQTGLSTGKGQYRHFMQKEIFEQPQALGETLYHYLDPAHNALSLAPELIEVLHAAPRLTFTACGTAYYACMVGGRWFESLARKPVDTEIASELRCRDFPWAEGGAVLAVSQSGETLDTLEALREAKRSGQNLLAIVNTIESTMERESAAVARTLCGPEIGVASTKAFTAQLTVLYILALAVAQHEGKLSAAEIQGKINDLQHMPALTAEILKQDAGIDRMATKLTDAGDIYYLGRGMLYPIALEGALKLKEISYIHAEGFAAGEMKHGPIALIDKGTPVVVLSPSNDPLFEKNASNIQEIQARGGEVLLVSDQEGCRRLGDLVRWQVVMPEVPADLAPLFYAMPVQMLAYHIAAHKGTDVDQPRNLAKSVTVE